MEESVQPSWWQRNWKWFVPVGCLSIFALVTAFIGLIVTFLFWVMKSSDVYKLALDKVVSNPEVVEALGSPIQEGFFVTGSIKVSGTSGNADLSIPISGPKGEGTIYLEASKSEGVWTFSKLSVVVKDSNRRINLLDKGATTPAPQLKEQDAGQAAIRGIPLPVVQLHACIHKISVSGQPNRYGLRCISN